MRSIQTYNTNHPDSLVFPGSNGVFPGTVLVAFAGVPSGAMHDLATEGLQTFNVWPLPSAQPSHPCEEYIGTVFEILYAPSRVVALDRQIPFSGSF
jgi:hypothetical protein